MISLSRRRRGAGGEVERETFNRSSGGPAGCQRYGSGPPLLRPPGDQSMIALAAEERGWGRGEAGGFQLTQEAARAGRPRHGGRGR